MLPRLPFLSLFLIFLLAISTTATLVLAAATSYPRVTFDAPMLNMRVTMQLVDAGASVEIVQQDIPGGTGKGKIRTGYFGIGLAEVAMSGPLLACTRPGSATATAKCVDMKGDLFDADRAKAQVTTLVSANYSTTVGAMVVTKTPTTYFKFPASGSTRVILARGEWETEDGKDEAGDHEDHWWQARVDIHTGAVTYSESSLWVYITLLCAWLVTVLLAAIGAALKSVHQSHGRGVSTFLRLLVYAVVAGCFAAVVVESDSVFKKQGNFAPTARAFGAGAAYLFSVMMIPVTKSFNLGHLAGSSAERMIPFHVYGGYVLLAVIFVHLVWLGVVSASFEMLTSAEDGVQNTVVAFISFILLVVLTVFSFFRHILSYLWFRLTHMLSVVIIVLFIVHWPPLGVCVAPSLALYLADIVMRAMTTGDITISAVELSPADKCKIIKITFAVPEGALREKWARSEPGQYVVLSGPTGIKSFHCSIPHPFTIAHRARDGSTVTLIIRALGTSTLELYEAGEKLVGLKMQTFIGPIGIPEMDISLLTDAVLVSGGIGVTATLGLLVAMCERAEAARPLLGETPNEQQSPPVFKESNSHHPPCDKLRSITFVWCAREPELVNMVMPLIVEVSQRLAVLSHPVTFAVRLFMTGKGGEGVTVPDGSTFTVVIGRRPEPVEMEPVETNTNGVEGYLSCGPAALMEQAAAVAASRGALLHEEVFEW